MSSRIDPSSVPVVLGALFFFTPEGLKNSEVQLLRYILNVLFPSCSSIACRTQTWTGLGVTIPVTCKSPLLIGVYVTILVHQS